MSTRRKKQRKRGDEIKSRNDFAGPKPWQNSKLRRYGVGTGERGDEIEREAINTRRKKQKKREAMKKRRKK